MAIQRRRGLKRRTPLKRGKPPVRKTPLRRSQSRIRAKRPNSAASRREGNSAKHLALIRRLPCCVSGRPGPSDPHHIKSGPARLERGIGLKATDQWAVPLSRAEHNKVEDIGSRNEEAWFRERGVPDIVSLAKALYAASPNFEAMQRALYAHAGMRG